MYSSFFLCSLWESIYYMESDLQTYALYVLRVIPSKNYHTYLRVLIRFIVSRLSCLPLYNNLFNPVLRKIF